MSTTRVKSTLYLANALPATYDKAGYEALTWVKVSGIGSAGAPAFSQAVTEVPDLESGIIRGVKAMKSGEETDADFRYIASDAGQALVKTCADAAGDVSMKWLHPSGTNLVTYATGIVFNLTTNMFDGESYEGSKFKIRINTEPLQTTPP